MTYFVEKEGLCYKHGIFWIGDDPIEGATKCDMLAKSDVDNWHDYVLKKFGVTNMDKLPNGKSGEWSKYKTDAEHEEVYRANKSDFK